MTISVSGQYVQIVVWEHVREESWERELIRERCDEFILHPYAIKNAQHILRNIRWALFLVASQRKSSSFRMKMSILFPVTSCWTLAEEWKGYVARISAENDKQVSLKM